MLKKSNNQSLEEMQSTYSQKVLSSFNIFSNIITAGYIKLFIVYESCDWGMIYFDLEKKIKMMLYEVLIII